MADSPLEQGWNVVTWALSGSYDEDRPVLIDADQPNRSLSKKQAIDLVARLSGSFQPGSTVCVHLYNDIIYPVLVLAILASHCEWTGTNPAYTSAELSHHFAQSETRYVITDQAYVDVVHQAITASGQNIEIIIFSDIVTDKPGENDLRWRCNKYDLATLHSLLTHGDESTLRRRLQGIPNHSPATAMSTSGTTGLPKMVQRSHRSLVLETGGTQDHNSAKPFQVRRLYCTPIFHAFSFPEMVINTIRLGFPSFYMRRFDESFANKVHEFGITETMAAPAMLLKIIQWTEKHEEQRFKLQGLRTILCAGAALASRLRASFLQLFDDASVRIVQVWGMTEGGWFATFWYPEHDDTGSIGRPLPTCQIRVSEVPHAELPDGRQVGELLVKGPQLLTTYKGHPDATKQAFNDGWLRTGDIGYCANGKVYIIDRAKDIIKVNGWTISPAELEAVLHQMPVIVDAAALSYGTGTKEHVAMFVVAKEPSMLIADIKHHLLQQVARFKVATCEIHLVDSLPRNSSGKILRGVLRHQLQAHYGNGDHGID
uniref:Acyl-CoA ligase M9 n=1 Tax=Phoma sp. (strain ATCC 20986 / MF5453) TaxID=1828523 RepID=MFM9_PHOSM|nr:RecName: Full=Acyl-CoA ligase M9; AltName: Full=Squalestatin S1 biosynthesis cluster protein M9 [Phoma sp. MF5453]AMY15066.1 acyl-CoA synthetase/ligase [Phoma sp. MF5453]